MSVIYKAVRKDLGTGSITGASQQSYVVPYYVFTDNSASPRIIYEQARSENGIPLYDVNNNPTGEKLPVYGTVDSTTYVSNINIERASENNLIAVPQYGLSVNQNRDASYTCWNYTVTFSASDTTTVSSGDPPWENDKATSCSFSPKTYERYDNKTLIPNYSEKNDTVMVPNYPLLGEKYSNLYNTVGDDNYRNRTVYNYLINFSYAVRRFDAEWLPLYMNTMNLKDCVICGIPIKKYCACINELKVDQAEWNGKTYYNVSVEVEIQFQQRITYDEYVSSGHRAFMLEGSENAIDDYLNRLKSGLTKEKAGFVYKITNSDDVKKYPVPIEELTDLKARDKVPLRRWFMKKKNLGYFEGITKVHKSTETVPIKRRVFLIESVLGDSMIVISFINPNNYDATDVFADYSGIQETLYFTGAYYDNEYVYSINEDDQGAYVTNNAENIEELRDYPDLRFIIVENEGTANERYFMKKEVTKHSTAKTPVDPYQGQYTTIQSPLALNKFGGVYFADNETNTIDDVTSPGKIDMYDPMLGKIKDYQHVARDWAALKFPVRGFFWASNADNNYSAMQKVSKYFD